MDIDKITVRESPYPGVFCSVNEELALVPKDIKKKELLQLKKFDVEIIKTKAADSILLGVLLKGVGNKFVAPELLSEEEEDFFSSKGIEVLQLGNKAYGNMMALNKNGGIVSAGVEKKFFSQIQDFFGIKLKHESFSCTDLVGSSIVVTDKGFIVNPEINEKEFSMLKKLFRVNGRATTANYGDIFVGNDVIANSQQVFVGSYTSGTELMRIDEGFRGD